MTKGVSMCVLDEMTKGVRTEVSSNEVQILRYLT